MDRRVSYACGGFVANHDRGRAHGDGVRRTHADACAADGGGGQKADDHHGMARGDDRAADMGDGRRAGGDHRTHVQVGDAGGWRHGNSLRILL